MSDKNYYRGQRTGNGIYGVRHAHVHTSTRFVEYGVLTSTREREGGRERWEGGKEVDFETVFWGGKLGEVGVSGSVAS